MTLFEYACLLAVLCTAQAQDAATVVKEARFRWGTSRCDCKATTMEESRKFWCIRRVATMIRDSANADAREALLCAWEVM